MNTKLIKKIKLTYKITVLTGLHIGGGKDSIEIGGLDKTIVRTGIENKPYIPGSSLRGKIRCLLEQISGVSKVGESPEINAVFGFSKTGQPSKLIFRDFSITDESYKKLKDSEFTDLDVSELKFENVIDRVKGNAEHPRIIERIPAGAEFIGEIIINIWDKDEDGENSKKLLEKGIKALENDYLGGNGSRGYGQVKLEMVREEVIDLSKL